MTPPNPAKKRLAFLACILIGLALISLTIQYPRQLPSQNNSSVDTSTQGEAQEKATPGRPKYLKIPKINVNAVIDHVGLTPAGDLDVPKRFDSTGWYKDGVRPGEAGSSVIDGHFGWKNNEPGVFNNLHNLQKGDELYIEDEKGLSIRFIVRGSRLYLPNENAAAVFHSDDGRERLNLITCQGTWDGGQQGYTSRLVVFADKEQADKL